MPLGEERFAELYELRILLEPVVLKAAVSRVPPAVLDGMERDLLRVAEGSSEAAVAELDRLEDDLHVRCLGFGGKPASRSWSARWGGRAASWSRASTSRPRCGARR